MISTVFLGTPAAAIPSLTALAESTEVRLVMTRPDRPRGRSRRARPSPIKETATELGLPIEQPSDPEELETALAEVLPFDAGVVVAFGMILSPTALTIPRHGFVNVHFSVLPRWRGAAPVERAILAGDELTGVTLMVMDEGLDTGPVLSSEKTSIGADETAGEVTARLAQSGARLLSEHLADFVDGRIDPRPQPDEGASYAHRVTSAEAALSAGSPSVELLRAVRAYSPRPGARLGDGALKVWKASPTDRPSMEAGRLDFDGSRLYLGTGDDTIELVEVQPPGGRRMSGAAWARGKRGELGRLV